MLAGGLHLSIMSMKIRPVFKIARKDVTAVATTTAAAKVYADKPTLESNQIMQVGSVKFRFDLIYRSAHFRKLLAKSMERDLIRDVCDEKLSSLTKEQLDELPLNKYLNIVQKSDTWFLARSLASGTASVVGKNCNLPKVRYPTPQQCEQAWVDLQNKKPFVKTHAMRGHMKWGVGYEDPALVHFADSTNLGVIQVGTIHLPMSAVYQMGTDLFGDDFPDTEPTDDYLLVSPDGVVGIPEPGQGQPNQSKPSQGQAHESRFRQMYHTLVGMLEIKCISPFHHLETDDDFLVWVDSMDRRQWTNRKRIPLVYIVQMALQALAGHHRLRLNENAAMWFLRWCPQHYVIYKFSFHRLFQLGCWVIRWYHSVYSRRIKTSNNPTSTLTPLERKCQARAQVYYDLLLKEADYTYTKLECYPEFEAYREATRHFKFKVEESDQVEFGLGHTQPGGSSAGISTVSTSDLSINRTSTHKDMSDSGDEKTTFKKKKRFHGLKKTTSVPTPAPMHTTLKVQASRRKPSVTTKKKRRFLGLRK